MDLWYVLEAPRGTTVPAASAKAQAPGSPSGKDGEGAVGVSTLDSGGGGAGG